MPLSRPAFQLSNTPLSHNLVGKARIYFLDQRRQVLRERSRFPICFCVGSTPVHSRRGIGYQKFGTCRKEVQPRKCTDRCTGVEFPVDGPKEQERQEYLAQVHLAERSVGCAPCVVRRSNGGANFDLSRRLNNSRQHQSGSNPLKEMGRIEDLAAEMRSPG